MRRLILHSLTALIFSLLLSACLGPVPELYPENPDQRPVPIYLTGHGWHVGIVVETNHPQLNEILSDIPGLPRTRYLEFGWGDAGYYPHPDPGWPQMLRAGLLPTESVLHIAGFDLEPTAQFPGSRVVRLQLSEAGLRALIEFLDSYVRRDAQGHVEVLGTGLYADSLFVAANRRYFFPFTSNWWTARGLRSAGLPITPLYAVTEGNLSWQALRVGEALQ